MKKQKKQKIDNKSFDIRKWSTKKLKEEAIILDEIINDENFCFGCKDLIKSYLIERELENRNVKFSKKLVFR